ncbi:MAG TPA: hypothetical protein VKT72_08135 [Candidatus Baltobacteraceae bacterium]|nr:hypothetical protein [Candidatus Baltobacteraceae bacterium]
MARRKAQTAARAPRRRRGAASASAARAGRAASNEFLDRYSNLVKNAINGNLHLATRAQHVIAKYAAGAQSTRPGDLGTAWSQVLDVGMSAYESYVKESIAYWDQLLSAAERSLTSAKRK